MAKRKGIKTGILTGRAKPKGAASAKASERVKQPVAKRSAARATKKRKDKPLPAFTLARVGTAPSEAWLHRVLLEAGREMVFVFDGAGKIVRVNRAVETVLGYGAEALLGREPWDLIVPEDRAFARTKMAELLAGGDIQTKTLRLESRDGRVVDVAWSCRGMTEPGGGMFIVGVALDVTAEREARASLERSERSARAVLEAIPDLLFRLAADGTYLAYQGPSKAKLLMPPEKFVGKKAGEVLPPHIAEPTMGAVRMALETGQAQTFEYGQLPDSPDACYEVRVAPSGTREVVALVRDVTRERGAARRERRSEERYRAIVETCLEGVWLLDDSCRTAFVNERMATMLGVTAQSMLGREVFEFMPEEQRNEARRCFAHPAREDGGGGSQHEVRFKTASGADLVTLVATSAIVDPARGESGGRGARGTLAMVTDITPRARAEEALQREQRLFLRGPVVAFRWRATPGWPVEYVSANIEQFGYRVDDLLSGRIAYAQIVHPEDVDRVASEARAHAAAGDSGFEQHYRLRRADGRYVHVQDFTSIVRDATGKATHYEGYIFDDTRRLETAQALADSQQRLALLVKLSPIGVVVWNPDRTVREWNPAAAEIFGYPEAEAIGMRAERIVPVPLRPVVEAIFEQLTSSAGGESSRNANLTRDGREIVCEWHNTPLVDDDGTVIGIASMVRDVTAEIMALRDLEQREEDLRLITDALPALIAYVDRDGRYRFNNRQYVNWLGREPAELRGQRLGELFGQRFADELKKHDSAVAAGRTVRFENRIRTSKGERDVDVTFVPHIHEGAYHGHYVLALDVTDRKVVERELAEHREQLEHLVEKRTEELEAERGKARRAEQLASLGTLAAGLGHDMNNMLLPMRCALDALGNTGEDAARSQVETLKRSIEFLGQLSADLLLLASSPEDGATSRARTDLAQWWARDGTLLASAGGGVNVQIDIPARLPPVAIAPEQLSRAILNLIVNAAEATGGRGLVRVWAREEPSDAATGARNMVSLGVTDDGPGMPSDVASRALEPFYTTKKRGFSTGLGLSIVHAVAKAAGGSVRIGGGHGGGTTVCLVIPVARAAAETNGVVGSSHDDAQCDSKPPRPRTARLSLADGRVSGYIAALLRARSIPIEEAKVESGPGESAIWVTDPGPEVEASLKTRTTRKTIVVGDAPPEWKGFGAILIADPTDIAAIAAALR